MHLDRNVCRSLPCRPFASACLEHSIDSAVRGFSGGFAVGVVLLAAGGFAGGVCAITAFAERRLMIATTVTIRIRRPPVCGQRCARSRISWTHGTRQHQMSVSPPESLLSCASASASSCASCSRASARASSSSSWRACASRSRLASSACAGLA